MLVFSAEVKALTPWVGVLEMDKCIGCAKCVRACDEVQGSFILGMAVRGYDTKVIAGNDTGFEKADCVSCGPCVFECPVAALEEAQTRVTVEGEEYPLDIRETAAVD